MTRTFSKNQIKKLSSQKQRGDTDSRSIKKDSAITQTHLETLNLPPKGKTQGIRDCVQKIRIYTQLFPKKLRVHATMKTKLAYMKKNMANKQAKTKFTPSGPCWTNMPPDPTQK